MSSGTDWVKFCKKCLQWLGLLVVPVFATNFGHDSPVNYRSPNVAFEACDSSGYPALCSNLTTAPGFPGCSSNMPFPTSRYDPACHFASASNERFSLWAQEGIYDLTTR